MTRTAAVALAVAALPAVALAGPRIEIHRIEVKLDPATSSLDARDTLVAEPPLQVVARFPEIERLHLGGLLRPEAAGRLARTAYCTREELGRGQVVLFLEEPTFRGWTLGTRRLFLNAILYGPGIGTRWSTPW